jgi:hypothetical protein
MFPVPGARYAERIRELASRRAQLSARLESVGGTWGGGGAENHRAAAAQHLAAAADRLRAAEV